MNLRFIDTLHFASTVITYRRPDIQPDIQPVMASPAPSSARHFPNSPLHPPLQFHSPLQSSSNSRFELPDPPRRRYPQHLQLRASSSSRNPAHGQGAAPYQLFAA